MPSAPIVQVVDLGSYTLNAANVGVYYGFVPTRIHEVFYVGTVVNDATAIITGALVQADATAASPSGAALFTMTVTTALSAVNLVTALNVQEVYGDLIVYPGEAFTLTSNAGGSTGVGRLGILVEPLGHDSDVDVRSHVSGHPGSTDLPTIQNNVTYVTA